MTALGVATLGVHTMDARAEQPVSAQQTTAPAPRAPSPEPLRLPPFRVAPSEAAPAFELMPLNDEQRRGWIAQTRFRRVALGSFASLGTTALVAGLAGGGVALVSVSCSIGCSSNAWLFVAIPSVAAVAGLFALPAVFLAGAERYGVRGSYWATFGGLLIGLGASAAVVLGSLAVRTAPEVIIVSSTVGALLPFAGMAIGFELTARVHDEGPLRESGRSAAASLGFPTVAIERDRFSLGWTGTF